MDSRPVDQDKLRNFSSTIWGYKQGEMVSLLIQIGDRLGRYKALDGAGAVTAKELADKTGLQERWLLEWLRGKSAARGLQDDDDEKL